MFRAYYLIEINTAIGPLLSAVWRSDICLNTYGKLRWNSVVLLQGMQLGKEQMFRKLLNSIIMYVIIIL